MIQFDPRRNDPFALVRRSARLYDLGATLALIGLIGALLTVGGLAYEQHQSGQGIAALERMRASMADRVAAMEDGGEPGYRVRLARAQLDVADRILRRARSDERVLLDLKGAAATRDALLNLVKGQMFNDIMSLGDLAFDSTVRLSDAYHGTPSSHQRRLQDKVAELRRQMEATGGADARPLQGDDLDFFIAAAELDHISRVIREEKGIAESDPVYVNVLRRYLDDYYLRPGERPLPSEIRDWVDALVANRYVEAAPAPPSQTGGEYLIWIQYWPSCHALGLDSTCDWAHPFQAEGTLQVGTDEEWDAVRSGGGGGPRYRDDLILASLIKATCAMFPPDDVSCDDVLDTRISAQVLTLQDAGKTSVPRFATRQEAFAWLCARLRGASRRDTLAWVGQEPQKTVPYTLATLTEPDTTHVILGNVVCP